MLVKDEKYFDRFDRAFGAWFKDLESLEDVLKHWFPEEWLRAEFEKYPTPEEREQIKSLGGLDKLLEEFRKRLEEQEKRHSGGSKWIGTGGTSPFGNSGYHPEGIRVGARGETVVPLKSGRSASIVTLMIRFSSDAQHQGRTEKAAQICPDRCR
ncbi:MAG: hypothetical protein Ct9H300mP14_14050 [Gammaproteobacteria bacterium]|nr:MAG: hypothetical protein Ct9H300mP14_14050 [Gammaproteobacteria bacterium]